MWFILLIYNVQTKSFIRVESIELFQLDQTKTEELKTTSYKDVKSYRRFGVIDLPLSYPILTKSYNRELLFHCYFLLSEIFT